MAIITSTINEHVYIEILDNFHIPSIENWFDDNEIKNDFPFQVDDTTFSKRKELKHFFRKAI